MATTTNYNCSAKMAADIGKWLFGGGTGWTVAGCANTDFNGEYVFTGIRNDGTGYYSPYFSDGAGHYLYRSLNVIGTADWRLSTTLGTNATYTSSVYTAYNIMGLPSTWPGGITLSALGVIAAPTQPGTWTLHLLTSAASATSKGTEVSVAGYAAQSVTAVTNTATIDFGLPSETWGTITGALLQDGEDADRYLYFNVTPGVLTAANFRVIVPTGGLTETGIGDWNAAISTVVTTWLFGVAPTRPAYWTLDLRFTVEGLAYPKPAPQPAGLAAKNATTDPGIYWNAAIADYGTAPQDWGTCTGWRCFPMHIPYSISGEPAYTIFDTFASPMTLIEGQDVYWPANGFVVDLLNPPS